MSEMRIHCYGCNKTVDVDQSAMARGLQAVGWAFETGQTFCPSCARARNLGAPSMSTSSAPSTDGSAVELGQAVGLEADTANALEPFSGGGVSSERGFGRALRLMQASLSVLRGDPQLLVFPVVAMLGNLAVGVVWFALAASTGSGAHASRGTWFLTSLIVAYPVTFVSLYCGVALAAVLAGRLDGKPSRAGDGWRAANERLGIIAAWTLVVCTVGAVLRLIEQYVPLGGKIAVAIIDLSWSVATMLAVPVLAYENLGPRETFRRSSQIVRQRWGTQIGGAVGIGAAGALLCIPFIVLLFAGFGSSGAAGPLLVVLGGTGLFGVIAVQVALEQIFRVFVYRNAVGLETAGGPFAQSDLQTPFRSRRRRSR
jgi:hypothetical protein